MKIELNKDDCEFLKELQYELLTQDSDCQAEPRYWGVAERIREYGVDSEFSYDGSCIRNTEDCEFIYDDDQIDGCKEALVSEEVCTEDEIANISDLEELCEFLNEKSNTEDYEIGYYREDQDHVTSQTGCFLTKRACKRHIEVNNYHYNNGHTYAMTAWRNPEFERVMNILRTIDLKEE